MKKILVGAIALALGAGVPGFGQSLEDLNIAIHGYATQGFLYSSVNNFFTTSSSNGSPDWTEAVVNIGAQPIPKLRFVVQARYELLGNLSNQITIDFAMGDYKANDRFGVRFGKVKIPSGLFNEIQDIDPAYMWSLLPQSVYPLPSRNSKLSLFGGVAYGVLKLQKFGQLEYRGWSGELHQASNDGDLLSFEEAGLTFPDGLKQLQTGEAIHWKTPLRGLMIGASNFRSNNTSVPVLAGNGALSGTYSVYHYNNPDFFGRYEWKKLMVAGEYVRTPGYLTFNFGAPPPENRFDIRSYYGMATYKFTEKFSAGVYDSQNYNLDSPLGPSRYGKDWVVSGRYDFNQYLYAKAEEHFVNGLQSSDYDTVLNPGGLKTKAKLTILKIGVSF